ncbi:MAG: TM2 domain-containing protein [Bacteroidales bacterium]|nr:TM2 domain-containing protein [Bacteroidales bacterium]
MKKTFAFLSVSLFLIVIFVTSCTIERRHYMPGYHVNRVGQKSNITNPQQEKTTTFKRNTNTNNTQTEELNEPLLLASEKEASIITDKADKTPIFTVNKIRNTPEQQDSDCDVIILRNGNDISVKVIEVGTTEVKYLMCDNLNGPTFSKNISEIFMIKFANGTSKVFNEEVKNTSQVNNTNLININSPSTSDNPNDKNFIVAIILWFFLGGIGIHRFYLGHIGMGILYLLTGGLCGIGWIIDGIMLLTGGLQPKNGKYVD